MLSSRALALHARGSRFDSPDLPGSGVRGTTDRRDDSAIKHLPCKQEEDIKFQEPVIPALLQQDRRERQRRTPGNSWASLEYTRADNKETLPQIRWKLVL